jgi:hypothetical protein
MSHGSEMLRPEYYLPEVFNFARIALILIFAFICTRSVGRVLRALRNYVVKMMLKAGSGNEYEIEKRVQTVSGVSRNGLFVLIWTIALFMILKELSFDIRPLLLLNHRSLTLAVRIEGVTDPRPQGSVTMGLWTTKAAKSPVAYARGSDRGRYRTATARERDYGPVDHESC